VVVHQFEAKRSAPVNLWNYELYTLRKKAPAAEDRQALSARELTDLAGVIN